MASTNSSENIPAGSEVEGSLPSLKRRETDENEDATQPETKKSKSNDGHVDHSRSDSQSDSGSQSDSDNNYEAADVRQSQYFRDYMKDSSDSLRSKTLKQFRTRFHLQFDDYLEFVKDARAGGYFPDHENEAAPLEIFILGALRHAGGNIGFDDIGDLTRVPEGLHRGFFKCFIKVCRAHQTEKWAKKQSTKAIVACMTKYGHR